jgi:hypothetical protein
MNIAAVGIGYGDDRESEMTNSAVRIPMILKASNGGPAQLGTARDGFWFQ